MSDDEFGLGPLCGPGHTDWFREVDGEVLDSCDSPPPGNGDCDGEGQGVGTGEPGEVLTEDHNGEGEGLRGKVSPSPRHGVGAREEGKEGEEKGNEGEGAETGEDGKEGEGDAERAAGACELTYLVSQAIGGVPNLASALSRLAASSEILAADSAVNKAEEDAKQAQQKLAELENEVEQAMPDLFKPCAQKLREKINSTCNSGLSEQISLFLKYRDSLHTLVEENYAQVGGLFLLY
jgi:hypothetical protein